MCVVPSVDPVDRRLSAGAIALVVNATTCRFIGRSRDCARAELRPSAVVVQEFTPPRGAD
jgi:hypothetical protein